MVKNPHEVEIIFSAVMLGEPPHRDEEGDCTAMTGKSSFPRHEDFPESFHAAQIIIRLIEEAMSKTGTYDGTYKKSIQKRIQQSFRHAFPSEEASEYEPSKDES